MEGRKKKKSKEQEMLNAVKQAIADSIDLEDDGTQVAVVGTNNIGIPLVGKGARFVCLYCINHKLNDETKKKESTKHLLESCTYTLSTLFQNHQAKCRHYESFETGLSEEEEDGSRDDEEEKDEAEEQVDDKQNGKKVKAGKKAAPVQPKGKPKKAQVNKTTRKTRTAKNAEEIAEEIAEENAEDKEQDTSLKGSAKTKRPRNKK